MKITVTAEMMKKTMQEINRDYFTLEGLNAILEMLDDIDENAEFDPIAICCDFTEYDDGNALLNDYGYMVDGDLDEEEKLNALIKELEENTMICKLANGHYIVEDF